MFKEERTQPGFVWEMLGNIDEGRPNLGQMMPVAVYRLMQFTLRDVLIQNFGVEKTDEIFWKAGREAGIEFHKNILKKNDDFDNFIADLQEKLKEIKIGILKIEHADMNKLEFTMTVAEDLDCSGIPVCDEQICTYDEGFIHGILKQQTGTDFNVKEVDCWGSGDRVCRFRAVPK